MTAIYGRWPSFHDAEVTELHLWRNGVDPRDPTIGNVPVLMVKVHIYIETRGSHHTLATLRFEDVDDVQIEGFNAQNAILGLSIDVQERGQFTTGEDLPPYLVVDFRPAHGMSATFRCFRIEVVDAVRCNEDGEVDASR